MKEISERLAKCVGAGQETMTADDYFNLDSAIAQHTRLMNEVK